MREEENEAINRFGLEVYQRLNDIKKAAAKDDWPQVETHFDSLRDLVDDTAARIGASRVY